MEKIDKQRDIQIINIKKEQTEEKVNKKLYQQKLHIGKNYLISQ